MFTMPGSRDGAGGGIARVTENMSEILDGAFGKQQGSLIYRDAAAWKALPPGAAYQILYANQGANANPVWAYPPTPSGWLITSFTANNNASFQDLSSFADGYHFYEIVITQLKPASNLPTFGLQFHQGGAFLSSSYLGSVTCFGQTGTTSAAQPTNYLQLSQTNTINSGGGISGT